VNDANEFLGGNAVVRLTTTPRDRDTWTGLSHTVRVVSHTHRRYVERNKSLKKKKTNERTNDVLNAGTAYYVYDGHE